MFYGPRRYGPKLLTTLTSLTISISGYRQKSLRRGITTLIPKEADTILPQEHRPVTVSNILCRQFHRILASRMKQVVPLSQRQKAFRHGDGLADNSILLRSIIKDCCSCNKPLNICFIDVSKAFDSVSHDSLIIAATRLGVPGPIISYLCSLYKGCEISLQVGGRLGRPIKVKRDTRQGDPLSPILFNFLMDWVLSTLSPFLGVDVGKLA